MGNGDKEQLIKNIEDKARYMLMYNEDIKYLAYNHNSVDIGLDDVKCKLVLLDWDKNNKISKRRRLIRYEYIISD